MDRTLKAIVRYDGSPFAGWQVQPACRTVQGELENALSTIARSPVHIHGAGRTDAGVHAFGQVFSCLWPYTHDLDKLRRSLSKMLSPDIRVESIEEVSPDFHARRSATAKRYAYAIESTRAPDPVIARYAWNVPWIIDWDLLTALTRRIEGTRDFAGFQCTGTELLSTTRTIYSIRVVPGGIVTPLNNERLHRIDFFGDGFLYKMVRNLVGTLVDIARGNLPESTLDERLASPGPFRGYTAPAHGLALVEVLYDTMTPSHPTNEEIHHG